MFKSNQLSYDEYNKIRKEIITGWPTGADVDFEEAVQYLEKIPASKNFSAKLMEADKNKKTLA